MHEIVFHGKGGYSLGDVYNMPTWLRKLTYEEISKFYKEEKEAYNKASNKSSNQTTLIDSAGNVNKAEFAKASKPLYNTGASQK